MQLSDDKKLTLLYRVEPGCLGADGLSHIEAFCYYATKQLNPPFFALYQFVARYDKTKPECYYSIAERSLSESQIHAYLSHFDTNKSLFEEQLDELLTLAIERFFAR